MEVLEEWRDVVGYEGLYEVSNLGRVRNSRGLIRKQQKNHDGYMHLSMYRDGTKKNPAVHRLVWESFHGPIPIGYEIDHINTVRDDNRIENLRAVTPKDNCNNPITAERRREASRRLAEDPKWRQKNREAAKRRSESQEWQEKMREAGKRRSENQEWRNRQRDGVRMVRAKPVIQLDVKTGEVIREWPSARDAWRELGINAGSLSRCCNGKLKSAGGYRWCFAFASCS